MKMLKPATTTAERNLSTGYEQRGGVEPGTCAATRKHRAQPGFSTIRLSASTTKTSPEPIILSDAVSQGGSPRRAIGTAPRRRFHHVRSTRPSAGEFGTTTTS